MRWILACVVLAIVALILEQWNASRPQAELQSARVRETEPQRAPRDEGLELAALAAREELAPAAPAAETPEEALDLIALLREVAVAFAGQDAGALQVPLQKIAGQPARCEEVLLLLEKGGLRGDELASAGSVITLGVVVSLYSSPQRPAGADGHAFTVEVLEGLARVEPPEQLDLAQRLIEARVGEHFVLDLTYLPKILELRTRYPEQAELYSSLLVHMAENLAEGRGLEEFRALFLTQGQDPTAVQLSLSALLRTDAASWLPLAEELFANASGNSALRAAITSAIATSAPVELASSALARLAGPSMYDSFAVLGLREGGCEALAARYSELVSSDGNPLARRMLVSGLRNEGEPVLVGIAATDPDPSVRSQALLTSSLARPSGPALLDQLETLHGQRADPAHGISTQHAVLVAGNVLINSGDVERERTRDFLLRIAGDSSESDADRLSALRTLKPWMPAGALDNWQIGGQSVK